MDPATLLPQGEDPLRQETMRSHPVEIAAPPPEPPAPSQQEAMADEQEAGLAEQVLAALATMAILSKRHQADLAAALRRSGLQAPHDRLTLALAYLERTGCIENLVPLYDGGVLMSVTSRGIEKLNAGGNWAMFHQPRFLRSS